ncbi:MAG: CoA transferase [Tepidiformaceae bacterium]
MDALAGLKVLDLTSHIAAPYCTKLLADLGARVIKVERPGGDSSRRLGPFLGDIPGPERSATFQFLNTNKESLGLDLATTDGREVALRLAKSCDLVVVGLAPAQAASLGLTYEDLRARTEAPVLEITNFGSSGPYRDYKLSDTVLFAMGGEMYSHGTLDRAPLKLGGTAALLQSGAMGAVAAMGAVHARELHGVGQRVELSLFATQINSIDRRSAAILAFRFSGRVQQRPVAATSGIVGGIYPTADGYVEVTASFGNYWQRFVEMVDDDALRDPKWLDPATALDPAAKEEADGIVYPWMLSRTKHEVWAEARRAHAMVAPLFTASDIVQDPVFRERGLWLDVEHQALGTFPMLGRPYVLEKTPWRLRQPAPTLGQHTDALLAEAGYGADEIAALRRSAVAA